MSQPLRTVVFIPGWLDDADIWMDRNMAWVDEAGYKLVSVVDGPGAAWGDAVKFLHDGRAEVVVVGDDSHIPAGFVPRVDVVSRLKPADAHHRRPRRLSDRADRAPTDQDGGAVP